jgi:hypothetical protein
MLLSQSSWGWTKRGHEIVSSVAARILEEKKGLHYLRSFEFDLGYYGNAPDTIWRFEPKPIPKIESPEHYIDWTKDFEQAFGSPKNLPLEFSDFKKKMGDKFNIENGVVPYRIHGMIKRCKAIAGNLTPDKQRDLIECIGLLSHYTGDLSMPLHVSENHDGEMTGQKGVHHFFEGTLVDELDPQLKVDVMNKALAAFKDSEMTKLDPDAAVRWIMVDSLNHVDGLLKMDKETDRKKIPEAAEKFRAMILERLVQGAIVTAVVWSDILSHVPNFDGKKFIGIDGHPPYLYPGKESAGL